MASARNARCGWLDQMELALDELESSATEDEIAAERAVAKTTNVVAFTQNWPVSRAAKLAGQLRDR
jgi:transposase